MLDTDHPYVSIEQIEEGVAHLSVHRDGSLIAQPTRAVENLPNDDPSQSDVYRVELDGETVVSMEYDEDLTEELAVETTRAFLQDDGIVDANESGYAVKPSDLPEEEKRELEQRFGISSDDGDSDEE